MATIDESPRNLTTAVLNHIVESNVDSSRGAIKADLGGKIVYDDPNVFRRLRVRAHEDRLVNRCAESLKTDYAVDIKLLKGLVAKASFKSVEKLEQEEKDDKANDQEKDRRSGNHGSIEEKKMYAPLVRDWLDGFFFLPLNTLFQLRLFAHIVQFNQTTGLRKFENTSGMLKADEQHMFGFPSASPDITISLEGVDTAGSKNWRHRDAFGEVKPTKKQGPKPATGGTILPIVTQCADYARLFMSARPFMLFCVGILIFGTEFCVGIFDRDGITFSPNYDMFEDTETLVRVVRSLACELTINEIGLDPTVKLLTDEETKSLTGQNVYPSAVVSCAGRDLCTIGPPIWSSVSLLGRGTNVWCTKEYALDKDQIPRLRGNKMIMKTAWRNSGRTPESDIYRAIEEGQYPNGLARFKFGGDVLFPLSRFPITVRNLRNELHQDLLSHSNATPVLHRLVLSTIGRPMWDYQSEFDLLCGFRDAIRGESSVFGSWISSLTIS